MDYDDVIREVTKALQSTGPLVLDVWHSENYSGEHREWKEPVTVPPTNALVQKIIRAAAPILMEYGARLMREAAANGLEAYAKAYTEQKARAKADKDQKAARDFESMAMTCAFRSTEIRALDPATIVREAVK